MEEKIKQLRLIYENNHLDEEKNKLENELSKNIEELTKTKSFFNLPLKLIFSIISKVNFIDDDYSIELIESIITNTIKSHSNEKEAILILQFLHTEDLKLTFEQCISILSKLNNCNLFVQLYQEYQLLNKGIDVDYEYELQQKQNEIDNLKQQIHQLKENQNQENNLTDNEEYKSKVIKLIECIDDDEEYKSKEMIEAIFRSFNKIDYEKVFMETVDYSKMSEDNQYEIPNFLRYLRKHDIEFIKWKPILKYSIKGNPFAQYIISTIQSFQAREKYGLERMSLLFDSNMFLLISACKGQLFESCSCFEYMLTDAELEPNVTFEYIVKKAAEIGYNEYYDKYF